MIFEVSVEAIDTVGASKRLELGWTTCSISGVLLYYTRFILLYVEFIFNIIKYEVAFCL